MAAVAAVAAAAAAAMARVGAAVAVEGSAAQQDRDGPLKPLPKCRQEGSVMRRCPGQRARVAACTALFFGTPHAAGVLQLLTASVTPCGSTPTCAADMKNGNQRGSHLGATLQWQGRHQRRGQSWQQVAVASTDPRVY